MFTMNAAQNIKIWNMYLQFGEGCIQQVLPEIKRFFQVQIYIEVIKKKYFG